MRINLFLMLCIYYILFNSIPYNNNNSVLLWYYLWYRNGVVLLLRHFYIMELNTWFEMKTFRIISRYLLRYFKTVLWSYI